MSVLYTKKVTQSNFKNISYIFVCVSNLVKMNSLTGKSEMDSF